MKKERKWVGNLALGIVVSIIIYGLIMGLMAGASVPLGPFD